MGDGWKEEGGKENYKDLDAGRTTSENCLHNKTRMRREGKDKPNRTRTACICICVCGGGYVMPALFILKIQRTTSKAKRAHNQKQKNRPNKTKTKHTHTHTGIQIVFERAHMCAAYKKNPLEARVLKREPRREPESSRSKSGRVPPVPVCESICECCRRRR